MNADFLEAWIATGKDEGGYSDNPNDKGGKTNHGITEFVARAHGWTGSMRELPQEVAREIAKTQYWDCMDLDHVAMLSKSIAMELFDTGFNAGQATVVKFLQRFLNVANRMQKDFPDILVDGLMGKVTISALRAYLDRRASKGELVALRALNCLQGAYYIEIAEKREANEEFVFGWFANRIEI